MKLYVDDIRKEPIGFFKTKNYKDTIEVLNNNKIEILSLDHDLGLNETGELEPTGYDIVKYICQNGIEIGEIYIHTDNVVGRENMYETLIAARRRGFIPENTKIYNYKYM